MIDLKSICSSAKRIAITGHERPDGDSIGSALGLYNYLKKILSPDVTIDLFLDKLGPRYSYLKGYEMVDSDFGKKEPYDLFFGLDCSTTDRYGEALAYFESAKETVCIDHHVSNEGFGTHRLIDGNASSTGELVFRLIPDEELDRDIAICLYSAIISDTGVLKFSNTSPETLRVVARL
ncbi:MAG: DHH family phosphoesterase, partial [Lachnospiraceae bacterium]|nr:DHH family phosphoesterase [Lachnospiraceae bacterium]